MAGWIVETTRHGHGGTKLIVLSEYYLSTGDTRVLPAIQAIANMLANGADLFGAYGHGFGSDPVPSTGDILAITPYGPVNSAGLPCFLGMVLAGKCGVATPKAVESTIERANDFYGSFVNRGGIPYGENHACDWRHGWQWQGGCCCPGLQSAAGSR